MKSLLTHYLRPDEALNTILSIRRQDFFRDAVENIEQSINFW